MAKHTPIPEQKRLVAEWRRTEQPTSAFARSAGIHPNTFWSWTKKYPLEEVVLAPPATFMDVTPAAEPAPVLESITVRVGPPGLTSCELDFDKPPPPTWFAAVLREVAAC